MTVDHFPSEGDPISSGDLLVPKAKELARILESGTLPYVALRECHRTVQEEGSEVVETLVFDLDVERPQYVTNDIRRNERLSATFRMSDQSYPEVLALRKDFPRVPHLNLRQGEFPRSLCLYNEPYDELKLSWTPVRFVERIREWLKLTAVGKLHGDDQPLEPLFTHSGAILVIPAELASIDLELPEFLYFYKLNRVNGWPFFEVRLPQTPAPQKDFEFMGIATTFSCPPQPHGVIHRKPGHLGDLCHVTAPAGLDLLASLRERLRHLYYGQTVDRFQKRKLLVIIVFPKQRSSGDSVEISDIWGFVFEREIEKIGSEIGVWGLTQGQIGMLLDQSAIGGGADLELSLLTPMFQFSRKQAAAQNNRISRRMCGSQRSEWGHWGHRYL